MHYGNFFECVQLTQDAVIQHKSPTHSWQNKMAAGYSAEITVHSWQHKMAAGYWQKPLCATSNTSWPLVIQQKLQCTACKAI
jgi:hypothetical protein